MAGHRPGRRGGTVARGRGRSGRPLVRRLPCGRAIGGRHRFRAQLRRHRRAPRQRRDPRLPGQAPCPAHARVFPEHARDRGRRRLYRDAGAARRNRAVRVTRAPARRAG
ncbi:hypothetical protein MTBUT4_60163 [Magnetospirillum sp. UT-4]|nr:hypothetical protein MTBUT4_60163 [Magnetospirillum sp. UT-4]